MPPRAGPGWHKIIPTARDITVGEKFKSLQNNKSLLPPHEKLLHLRLLNAVSVGEKETLLNLGNGGVPALRADRAFMSATAEGACVGVPLDAATEFILKVGDHRAPTCESPTLDGSQTQMFRMHARSSDSSRSSGLSASTDGDFRWWLKLDCSECAHLFVRIMNARSFAPAHLSF